jgi:RNA polymerase sigma factor (sigma-70 family)
VTIDPVRVTELTRRSFTNEMTRHGPASARAREGLDDGALLQLAGSEPEAFGVFYRRHAASVHKFFLSRTACVETAADLTAETFAQAFLSRRRYRATGAPATAWLFAIARHQLAYFIRSATVRARARHKLGMGAIQVGSEGFERVEELSELATHLEAIQTAVSGLSVAVGDAVRFRVIDDLPYSVVASRLGCTQATARQRVARGLGQLAAELEVLR